MKIRDMFEKKITREIKGVIKVGQKDDENVYQELEEYVVTAELEKYMNQRMVKAYRPKWFMSVIGIKGKNTFVSFRPTQI